jgi:hypothetical protein
MALQSSPGVDVVAVSAPPGRFSYLDWGPVFAGAIAAAAISFLLLTFGGAIGLSLASPWPYAGASAFAIMVAVAWWTVMVQIGSFAAGGYLAGRLRARWEDASADEVRFRDGAHGFMVWALGILVGAIVLGLTAGATFQTAVQSISSIGSTAIAGSTAGGYGPSDYAVDYLLRAPATPPVPSSTANQPATATQQSSPASANDLREETSRIFASALANEELSASDRDYLTQLVAARTGLSPADAQKRVDEAIGELTRLEIEARKQLDAARKTAIVAGFLAAASLLAACAAACAGAALGGRHRDAANAPRFFGTHVW